MADSPFWSMDHRAVAFNAGASAVVLFCARDYTL
jgi:hypothetical protein